MQVTQKHEDRIAILKFGDIYPHYVTKVEKKGRTIEELNQVITWLTGFNDSQIQEHINNNTTFKDFFEQATINPNAHLITGVICGYRVEDIPHEFPITKNGRYMDRLIDELARGRKMDKILREEK